MTSTDQAPLLPLLIACVLTACSSSEADDDLFQKPGTETTAAANTSSASTGASTTTGGTSSSVTGGTTATVSSVSTSTTHGTTASTTTSTSSSTASSSTASSTTGAMTSTSTSSTSGGSTTGAEPTLVTVDLPENEDCFEVTCPAEAPYLYGCEIVFSESTDADACVVTEGEGVVFIKSGDTCSGSYVVEGSILCSSVEPASLDEVHTHCLVENKETVQILTDRCGCVTPSGTPGCE